MGPSPGALAPAKLPSEPARREGRIARYLAFFPPEDAALRRTGRLLYDLVTDSEPYDPEPAESTTHHALSAALADLRHMAATSPTSAAGRREIGLSNPDTRLALLAEKLAAGVGRLADALEAGL